MYPLTLFAGLFLGLSANASTLTVPIAHAEEIVWTEESLKELATAKAEEHHLNPDHFLKVITCESRWNPSVQSEHISNGVQEDSWGIVQINLPSHPDVTKEQALDPKWAIEWMASEWEADRYTQWSCWHILEKNHWKL